MSFYDNSSLAFLPSSGAGKNGKAYSIKPTDGTGDFTFSRGINLTATRVGPTGLIEKGRENLLTYSNAFSTSPWGVTGLETPTTGESGYDGTSNAWLLETSASSGRLRRTTSLSGVNTLSFYAKKGNVDYIAFFGISSGNFPRAWFNLATGNISNQLHHIDTKMEPVTGATGWYRCSITFDESVTELRLYPTDVAGSFSVGAGETSIIQDAQLEIGLAATDYIESGASTGKAGLLENEPRFDYSGGATCPSLLLEPSRTNLMLQSEYFDSYVKSDTSILTNQAQSPEGLVNASLVAETATNSNHYLGLTSGISVVSGTTYTFSVFIKKGDGASAPDYCQLTFNFAGFGAIYANFNLSNGTIGTSSGVTPLISDSTINGFWRCSITATATSTANTGAIVAFTNNNDSLGRLPSYLGNTASDFYAYGFQVEQGSYPTSYIPNHSGGSATRTADDCQDAGDTTSINSTEGVLYVEASALANDGTSRMISLSDATSANHIRIYPTTTNNRITIAVKSGNVNQYVYHYDGLSDITETWKVAVKYKANDFATFVNGTKVHSSTSGITPVGMNELQYNGGSSANPFYGNVKQTLVFPTALSDADCITLTT